jgi:hypothetical protein
MIAPKLPPYPKPQQLPRAERMTIAAGYHCMYGIVLCADTEETVQEYIKHDVQKIVRFPDYFDYKPDKNCALFAGAGDGPFIESLASKMWKGASGMETLDDMVTAFEDVLLKEYQRLITAFHKDDMPQAHFMVAIRSASQSNMELLKITGPIIERHVVYGAVGYGLTLHTYLTSRLLHQKTGLEYTSNIMAYMIDQVKTHVAHCGGKTDLYTLDYDGKCRQELPSEIQKRTNAVRAIDLAARNIAGLAMNPQATEKFKPAIEHYVNELFETVKQLVPQKSKGQP